MLLYALLLAATAMEPINPAPLEIPAVTATAAPSANRALDLDALDDLRGGDGSNALIITDQMLKAVNTGNSVNGQTVGSGDVSLGANAFAGYEGIGNFAINTGHNNNLQSTVSVSIIVTPAAP